MELQKPSPTTGTRNPKEVIARKMFAKRGDSADRAATLLRYSTRRLRVAAYRQTDNNELYEEHTRMPVLTHILV
jgi:hypothetical protein